jgi:hypothetical protein
MFRHFVLQSMLAYFLGGGGGSENGVAVKYHIQFWLENAKPSLGRSDKYTQRNCNDFTAYMIFLCL